MERIEKEEIMKKWMVLIGIVLIIYFSFRFLLPIIMPFVIAGLVSILYYPILRRIFGEQRIWKGKTKKFFLAFAVFLFYFFIFFTLLLLGRYLWGEGESLLLNIPFYQVKFMCFVEKYCSQIDVFFHCENGVCYGYIEGLIRKIDWRSATAILPKLTSYSVRLAEKTFHFIFTFMITIIATFFMIQDYDEISRRFSRWEFGIILCNVVKKCKETLKVYIKAQGLIMLLDGILCIFSFFIIGQPYALLLGLLTALIDALPVMGAGFVLIPYTGFLLLTGELGKAGILFLTYLLCILIRQFTEPRMIGEKVGMKPLFTIFSMYVGVRLFGILGFLLGPVGFLIGKELYTLYLAKIKE